MYMHNALQQQDFVSAWRKHEKPTAEEKGVIIFDLKFPVSLLLLCHNKFVFFCGGAR